MILAYLFCVAGAVLASPLTLSKSHWESRAASICTPTTAGASIPQPQSELNLLHVGQSDAPYDLSQSALLQSISFPNGLQCRQNLVILFPGTGIPALDSYASTFIPIFKDANVANADVMVVSNPSYSLGDAQTTSEYAAFAINYAALVLGRKATIVGFSQGTLNIQWALKYWPSTRQNLRNYVGMSPDYDGTLDATLLCNPQSLLAGSLAQLIGDTLNKDGFGTILETILGIGKLPTLPEQFKLYLLTLVTGGVPQAAASLRRRYVPWNKQEQAEAARAIKNEISERSRTIKERQAGSGNPSALAQLLGGLAESISQALASLLTKPNSVLEEVLANYGKNLQDLKIPATLPPGCLPSIWQQVYFSNFVKVLANDYGTGAGDSAFVPSTGVFSVVDEVVQPQGLTGFEAASGFLKNASNILIQGNGGCPLATSVLNPSNSGLPAVVTHEGILYSGMGVAVVIKAVQTGGRVTVDMIDSTERCAFLSARLNFQQTLAQEATIPPALVRIILGGGDQTLATSFLPAEPAIKAYATARQSL